MLRFIFAAFLLLGGQASAALYSLDFTAVKTSPVLTLGDDASPSVVQGNSLDTVTGRVLFRTDAPDAGVFFSDTTIESYVIEAFILDQIDSPVESFSDISLNIFPSEGELLVAQYGVNGTVFPELDIVNLFFDFSVPFADASLETLVAGPLAISSGQFQLITQEPGDRFPRYILFFDVAPDSVTLREITPEAEVPLPAAALLFAGGLLPFLRRKMIAS
ncbi:MAG: hypothetical protein V2I43_12105 [Parvularcula sp.]|jgi:hypothetical protein|nr:hypothetical protein [Parvularcula sp.]